MRPTSCSTTLDTRTAQHVHTYGTPRSPASASSGVINQRYPLEEQDRPGAFVTARRGGDDEGDITKETGRVSAREVAAFMTARGANGSDLETARDTVTSRNGDEEGFETDYAYASALEPDTSRSVGTYFEVGDERASHRGSCCKRWTATTGVAV